MEKKTFVCETVKAVLTELAQSYPDKFSVRDHVDLQHFIDNLTQYLCKAYDKHLTTPNN